MIVVSDLAGIVTPQNFSYSLLHRLECQPVSARRNRVPLLAVALVVLGIPCAGLCGLARPTVSCTKRLEKSIIVLQSLVLSIMGSACEPTLSRDLHNG
jgi:hypothetical protein